LFAAQRGKGLILGCFSPSESKSDAQNQVANIEDVIWTETAENFNQQVANRLKNAVNW